MRFAVGVPGVRLLDGVGAISGGSGSSVLLALLASCGTSLYGDSGS